MKSDINIDKDGWLNITLEAETAKEAAQLVKLGMNKSATDKASVYVDETVRLYTSVLPVPSRRQAQHQRSYVRFQK